MASNLKAQPNTGKHRTTLSPPPFLISGMASSLSLASTEVGTSHSDRSTAAYDNITLQRHRN